MREYVKEIIQKLENNDPDFKTLDAQDAKNYKDRYLTIEELGEIIPALTKNKIVETININEFYNSSFNYSGEDDIPVPVPKEGDIILGMLGQVLIANHNIHEVGIFHECITPYGITAFMTSLKIGTGLKSLNFSNNSLNNNNCKYLSNYLKNNIPIESLSIQGNRIENDGLQAILESLEKNTKLKSIDIYDIDADKEQHQLLIKVLKNNHFLTKVNFYEPYIDKEEINRLLDINKKIENAIKNGKFEEALSLKNSKKEENTNTKSPPSLKEISGFFAYRTGISSEQPKKLPENIKEEQEEFKKILPYPLAKRT